MGMIPTVLEKMAISARSMQDLFYRGKQEGSGVLISVVGRRFTRSPREVVVLAGWE